VVTPPLPQPLCLPASEAGNHRINLSFHDNMSSGWCARVFNPPAFPVRWL
jgi:hypothetical protein